VIFLGAKRLADKFQIKAANVNIDGYYQTLAGIAQYHNTTPVTFDKRLREHDFGKLNGKPYKTISHSANKLNILEEQLIIEQGGESDEEVKLRVIEAYQEITKTSLEAGHDHILIVSHGGPLAIIMMYITEELDYQWPADCVSSNKMGNTSVTTLRISGCSGQIETFNCIDHLQSMLETSLSSDQGPAV
jgi:broad specificity phosphatase PhoE